MTLYPKIPFTFKGKSSTIEKGEHIFLRKGGLRVNANYNHLTSNKLIVLYLIQKKGDMTRIDLFDYILFKGYMDYFTLQQYVNELAEAKLICEQKDENRTVYTLYPQGMEILELFKSRIPHSIRMEINEYVQTSRLNSSSMLRIEAEVHQMDDGERRQVQCRVKDYDRTILDFQVNVSSEEEANIIRNNWLKKGMSLYRNLLQDLKSQ
nr:DUF4364 family protein [Bianquea renquensis]